MYEENILLASASQSEEDIEKETEGELSDIDDGIEDAETGLDEEEDLINPKPISKGEGETGEEEPYQ